MLSEGVCGLPRRAEGERRNASWVPSMVRRRGPAACGGGMDVSLCRRLGGMAAYEVVCRGDDVASTGRARWIEGV